MNLYRVTFHAEILVEAETAAEAITLPGWDGDTRDLIPIADLIGDVDELRAEDAELRDRQW